VQEAPRDLALDQLDALVGTWDMEARHRMIEGAFRGTGVFEWLPGRRFLIHRTEWPPDTVPISIAIIGGGDTPGTWPMHYFDVRGVMRVYQVTFDRGVLRIWRDHPGFSQRFSGMFEDGGRTIRGRWELNEDGTWKDDLQIVYRR
jgi:hypothetical protein